MSSKRYTGRALLGLAVLAGLAAAGCGANAVFADGHVQFISESVSLRTVFLMGARNDGQTFTID